jgi:hypothetical protein
MSSYLAGRLSVERHRRFVGRNSELELFQSAIAATELPFNVLYIFGPGGIGKTTLLLEFIQLCNAAQIPVVYLDARTVEASPESFLDLLQHTMSLAATDSPLQVLAAQPDRQVLVIDTYEKLASLDDWFRDVFLPQLPEQALIILAGRQPPSSAWRMDPGWQILLHTLSLRNLSPAESQIYLTKHKIPAEQHQAVLEFTHGHPLALSLITDVFAQRRDIRFRPEAVPDIVKMLLEKFLEEIPSPAHRMALEACALVRFTTEALLTEMLLLPNVHELFEWLRALSFIESGLMGIFPHDLAREVLLADLHWRNPDWYGELHRCARIYYIARLGQSQGQERHRILFDFAFLHHKNPAAKPYLTWQESYRLSTDTLRESDRPALLGMVTQHEGEESAHLAAHWLTQQPQGVLVIRDDEQQPAGFMLVVGLQQASPEDLNADPATRAAWKYLQNYAPLRPGETAIMFRFWMARNTYQAVSPIQSLIFIHCIQQFQTTAGLAFSFSPCAEPDFWAAGFTYSDLVRLPEADFEVGGRCYGVYGHDWRVVPHAAWRELMAKREVAASAETIPVSFSSEPLVVLSQPEFSEAVQDTLRHFCRPDALQTNPLLQSRLIVKRVAGKASKAERIAALRSLVQETVESLQSYARDAKLYHALSRAYLHPAATQEQAADLLNLPFGTFRRHLKAGIARVVDILWQREISGLEK